MRIDISDLIGRTYDEKSWTCWHVTREVAKRVHEHMLPHELPDTDDEIARAIESPGPKWALIGTSVDAATLCGDIIHGHKDDGRSYTAAVVDSDSRQCITATPEEHTHTRFLRRMRGVVGIYRRRA